MFDQIIPSHLISHLKELNRKVVRCLQVVFFNVRLHSFWFYFQNDWQHRASLPVSQATRASVVAEDPLQPQPGSTQPEEVSPAISTTGWHTETRWRKEEGEVKVYEELRRGLLIMFA